MHRLSSLHISNFRSCRDVALEFDDYTPLVGQNNVGKSTILSAIQWLLKPTAPAKEDFRDAAQPITVVARIEGITQDVLAPVPDEGHRVAIAPFCRNDALWIRVSATGTTAKGVVREVWEPADLTGGEPQAWRKYPTGLPEAVAVLLPEPLFIEAMKDVQKDLTSNTAGTTIKRLIEEIAKPVTARHKPEIDAALGAINRLIAGGEGARSESLANFDRDASAAVKEFFPGLNLRLQLPEIEVKEFFKAGTLMVKEDQADSWGDFKQLGSGAQRAIEMALIRYLAEAQTADSAAQPRKILLIDEPELYLHPQGVVRLRNALRILSRGAFQVVFSTHSPLMLDRDNAAHTVVVKKTNGAGTVVRKPLAAAVKQAILDRPAQAKTLFALGCLAEIYFSDKVVLCEGKTDQQLMPLAYERMYGRSADADGIVFVQVGGCGSIPAALDVLAAMSIQAVAVGDLDFAFVHATKTGLLDRAAPEQGEALSTLVALQRTQGFQLNGSGLPMKGSGTGSPAKIWEAADIWSCLAKDVAGAVVAGKVHDQLKRKNVWVWKEGCIEDVLGMTDKGEDAIMAQELRLQGMDAATAMREMAGVKGCFEWIRGVGSAEGVGASV